MRSNNYKVIIFDFFGVICSEIAPPWFREHFDAKEAGLFKDKYVRPVDKGDTTIDELFDTLSEVVGEKPKDIKEDWLSSIQINKDLVSLIIAIKEDFRIALASNASADFLYGILRENDLEKLFDKIIISSEIGAAKPDPVFFKKMSEILKEGFENLLFFDDNPENIEAAQKLGIEAHLFRTVEDVKFLKG